MSKKNKYQNIADEECKQAVIFARVSSEEQKKGASIDAQLKTVIDYCNNRKFKILDTFDIVESSTRGGRLKFYEMLEFVKQQKHKTAIVVNCVDRLQRGYKECVELDDLRKQGRIEIHFYKEGFYLHKDSTSSDILRWDMGVLSAKMYVGSLRDNVIRSQEYKREQGQWQSCAPVGYLNVPKTKTSPADIIIDPDRAPKVKQYIFSGLVRCGCCGSLMTCETKVKDDKHSYNYLKCNKLRSKCSQKPINEAKVLKQLEQELSLPLAISDDMLKNIKAEVKKQLKEENINTASLKRDITIKLSGLDEQLKTLFRGYIQGKCDEKMYNELKTEIELEKEKLQKDMDRYLEIDTDTDEMLANIAEIAANVGKFLKSPIISQKRDILNLILSDCKTEGKNLCFSIAKPFDKLLKTPEINKWCR